MKRGWALRLLAGLLSTGVLTGGLAAPVRADEPPAPEKGGSGANAKKAVLQVHVENLGAFARGSNNLMYPFHASNGKVYIGTYGPRPAKFYEIDPATGKYATFTPGDYQLRMITETSNGHLWTVSNYDSLLYEFSPQEGAFVGAHKVPVGGDQMVCVADANDRIYTVKDRRIYSFDARTRTFRAHGEVMPGGFMYNRGQHAQFGPDGKLYGVSDTTIFCFDPQTDKVRQIVTQDDIAPNIQILMGDPHVPAFTPPWIHGYAWVNRTSTKGWTHDKPIDFSHFLLFRCNVETGAVETHPLGMGDMSQSGSFYDAVDKLHYFLIPGRGRLTLNGFDWESRNVRRRIELPYGDRGSFVVPSRKPRHILFAVPYLGRLLELDLAAGTHRTLFENPQPAEIRALAVGAGQRAFGVAYDCGHVFERETASRKVGRSIGFSCLFRICYGPAAVSRDARWVIYPLNCGMGVRGTGAIPTEGAAIGRHLTPLLPIHMVATSQDEFLAVHRGPWYTHQEVGSWDGSDETVAKLSEVGKGIFRLRASSGAVEELPGVAPASLAAMDDGTAIGCDRSRLWKLQPGERKPEVLCPSPPQPVRLAASPDGTRVLLATTTELFEDEVRRGGLKRLAGLPFPPERGLFCFKNGAVACAANNGLAVFRAGETTPLVWLGELPGKVGPVAAPDEESLFTVDRDLVRIRWE